MKDDVTTYPWLQGPCVASPRLSVERQKPRTTEEIPSAECSDSALYSDEAKAW